MRRIRARQFAVCSIGDAVVSNKLLRAPTDLGGERRVSDATVTRRIVLQHAMAFGSTSLALSVLAQARVEEGATSLNYLYAAGDVRRYGAVGDGTTDDTAAIQAALDSGETYVFCAPGQTYLVRHSGELSIKSELYRYCLSVPSGVQLYGNGATIKLAHAQNVSIVALRGDGAGLSDIALDGNRTNQTVPSSGEMANVIAYDVERARVERVTAKNARQYAGRFLNCRQSRFVGLRCEDSFGDGWSFGTSGSVALEVMDSFIDDIHAENCEGSFELLEGNGCILTTQRCEIGTIEAKNCAGGIKLQNSSFDNKIGTLTFDGGDQTIASANSGVKIQGSIGLRPSRNSIASIVSRNAYGNGLVVRDVGTLNIDNYVGTINGSGSGAVGSDRNDVDIELPDVTDSLVTISRVSVENPSGTALRMQGGGNLEIQTIAVLNPRGRAVHDASSAQLKVGSISATDDQGVPTMTYVFQSTGSSKGRIGEISTNLLNSKAQRRVGLAAGQYELEVGGIHLGSRDATSGVVELARGRTDTSVACAHVWCNYVGGECDYFRPVIEMRPLDQSIGANDLAYLVANGIDATGFTILHTPIHQCPEETPPRISWRVAYWRVAAEPLQG